MVKIDKKRVTYKTIMTERQRHRTSQEPGNANMSDIGLLIYLQIPHSSQWY